MEFLMILIYGTVLALHIWALVRVLRTPSSRRWTAHILLELLSAAAAAGMAFVFDGIRGSGFMPGMSYIMEFFYSLVATGCYILMAMVSLLAMLVSKCMKR